MAESIVKLRVDSNEYDSKIKRATENLNRYVDEVKKSGDSLAKADKETLDYVKALGSMETVATKSKAKIREMTDAFTDLSVKYKNMTDEEKNSPFGRELAKSLDQLKGRINESKQQLEEVNQELGNTNKQGESSGGILDKLADKFGLSGGEAIKMGAALGVATAACKVAKDAFFNNEEQLDEWGRVVASSESLYKGFLNALNTGDISGYLSKMSTIVAAARAAYDALDELATFNAFNQINVARTRWGFQEAQNDFREGIGSKEDVQRAGNAMKDELRQKQELQKKAYAAEIVKIAEERGVNSTDLARVMLGKYGDYKALKSLPLTGTSSYSMTDVKSGQTWTQETKVAANERERMGEMLRKFNDDELNSLQHLGASMFQTGFEIGQVDRQIIRLLKGGGGGGGHVTTRGGGGGGRVTTAAPPPTGSIAEQEAKVQALTKAWREATDQAGRDGYLAQLEEAKKKLEEMQGKTETLVEGSMKALSKELSSLQEAQSNVATTSEWNAYEEKIKAVKKQMSELKGEVQEMATGFSGFNDNTISAWLSGQQGSLGGMEIGSAGYMQTMGNIIDTKTLQNIVNAALQNGLTLDPQVIEDLWDRILGGENIPDGVWMSLQDSINAEIEKLGIEPISIDVKTGNVTGLGQQVKESWQGAAKAVQAVGSALQQIDDPAAKIVGIVGQAVANIALGFAQATTAAAGQGPLAWIAAIAGGIGTMMSTIAAIHSATGYAEGGIVRGNSYSGDNLWGPGFGINAGELVLNRAQQGALASQLEGASESGSVRPYISGEYLYLGLNNYLRRQGMGEIVTSSNRR